MALIPYDPFRRLSDIKKDLDFFEKDIFNLGSEHFGAIRVDVHETENQVVVTCDIPGLEKKEDLNLSIVDNILNISGSINRANEVKEENFYRKERYVGRFNRNITLPSPVSDENVKATYRNGVLEVVMQKTIKENKKKIDIDFH